MSTPHVPQQPNHGPQAVPPASGQYASPGQHGAPGQYPAPGQYGMPVPPPAKNRKLLWIILGVLGTVLVLIVVGVIVLVNVVGNATNRVQAISDDFTRLIVSGQSEQAYDKYMNPALAQSLPKADFVAGIAGLELDNSCKPHYDSVIANSVNGTNTADVAGTLQCQGKSVQFRYSFVGNDLKMNAIRLQPQG